MNYRIICKMATWLPREPVSTGHDVLTARTEKDALLVALNAKEEKVWVLHADHVRRWEAEHRPG